MDVANNIRSMLATWEEFGAWCRARNPNASEDEVFAMTQEKFNARPPKSITFGPKTPLREWHIHSTLDELFG